MDATKRPLTFSKDFFAYAENKKILDLFQNMFEKLTIDRPENPASYLRDFLLKGGGCKVPNVYVLGPPGANRKLVCTTLANHLKLIYITTGSLIKDLESNSGRKYSDEMEISYTTWADLIKRRVEKADCLRNGWLIEGFPKTRRQAYTLRKIGIFPTHIVVIEDAVINYQGAQYEEDRKELLQYAGQKSLILDLHRSSYMKKFIIGKYSEAHTSLNKVVEFVRSSQRPSLPYLPRVLLFGPYGSGRKTMAKMLAEKYNLVQVDYQEELRKAALKDTPLKQKFYEILKTSEPVPNELLVEVASQRLLKEDCLERGWVMFNFPDTKKQADLLIQSLQGFQVNRAIFLGVTLWNCMERVEPRRLDPFTGQMYHLNQRPCFQRVAMSRLIQLPQDSAESVKAEHEIYSRNVTELRSFFSTCLPEDIVTEVDANPSIEDVFESVQGAILKSTKIQIPF